MTCATPSSPDAMDLSEVGDMFYLFWDCVKYFLEFCVLYFQVILMCLSIYKRVVLARRIRQ